jgi:hypothetical protein
MIRARLPRRWQNEACWCPARSVTVPGYKKMRLYHLRSAIIGEPDTSIEGAGGGEKPNGGTAKLV